MGRRSGYSSLNTIAEYEFDVLKLDLIFLKSYENVKTRTLMNYIIRGAKDLGVQPLCEGVECEEHYDFLKWIECEKAQANGAIELFKNIGYYDSPMAIEMRRNGKWKMKRNKY